MSYIRYATPLSVDVPVDLLARLDEMARMGIPVKVNAVPE